jgi:hypothetical protein
MKYVAYKMLVYQPALLSGSYDHIVYIILLVMDKKGFYNSLTICDNLEKGDDTHILTAIFYI